MFIDRVKIYVKSGDGGDGCVAFLREKYRPRGGPAGGDGGKGGDVILRVNKKLHTLLDFYYRRMYKAKNGRPGEGKNRHGKSADDLIIDVPPGTVVFDAESGEQIADLVDGEFIVARGGRGGRGNAQFATSTNQAPKYAEEGKPGEEKWLILELRLIADVGLVGLPNAGKSTIISRLTNAHPKIADYPFTTKEPHLGIAEIGMDRRLVIADIPGIIEGAHLGKGMGLEFLRHISRTKVIVILLDILDEPEKAYRTLLSELSEYSEELLRRPRIVALNKIDAADRELLNRNWEKIFSGEEIFKISAVAGTGLKEFLAKISQLADVDM
ncbi:GTPase ObgE [bacterium]|nr:GTPase ObgE [bacterium]